MNAAEAAAIDLFLDWLGGPHERSFERADPAAPVLASMGSRRLAISTYALYDAESDPVWQRRCAGVSAQIQARGAASLSLWIPPGADLPHGDRSEFIGKTVEAAANLTPGQRGQVEFPVMLTLKKVTDKESYVQVIGGLAPHWARLTGKAYGQYLLDTSAIHRLPEPEQRTTDLLEWVALLGNGMKAGASSDFKAEDAWTIRRHRHGHENAIIGAEPNTDPSNGTSVRRLLRVALRHASGQAAPQGVERVVLLTGIFRTIAEENATIALRGCDPALYTQFDLVCLVADGLCKRLSGRGISQEST